MNIILNIILTGTIMVIIDYFYLSYVSKYFNMMLTNIQGSSIKLDFISAALCYLTLVFGIYYFIISRNESVLNAMILGWIIYFVYEFTNKAIIKKWSWMSVIIDGVWGGFLFGITTMLVYYLNGIKIRFI